jgi:uncharacterized membrane protein YhaH (DUF805 family)
MGAHAFYCRPPHGNNPQARECFEKGVRTPLPRSLSAAGFFLIPAASFLANAAIAVRRHHDFAADEAGLIISIP